MTDFDRVPSDLTSDDVEAYTGAPLSDTGLTQVSTAIEAETVAQAARCRTDPYTASLWEALLRRVVVNLARRGIPLGVQFDESGGGVRLATTDPEVRRLEAPYRKLLVG